MIVMTLWELAAAVQGQVIAAAGADLQLRGVSIDTRTLRAGEVFFALTGPNHDGHHYVAGALAAGAAAAVVSKLPAVDPVMGPLILVEDTLAALHRLALYHRSKHPVPVVAVTGSYGKTTTKEMIALVLEQQRPVLKSEKNYNNEIGLPMTLLELTPVHGAVVVEMGMRGQGEIATLCRMAEPTAGVITGLGPVHLERLGTLEAIAAAKAELLEALPATGFAVVNGDLPLCRNVADKSAAPVTFFGLNEDCQVRASQIHSSGWGVSFKVSINGRQQKVDLPVPGTHNVMNALAAIGVGWQMGVDLSEAAAGLAVMRPEPMRLERIDGPGGSVIINDAYNANPTSMQAALQTLRQLGNGGIKIAVLGNMLELGGFAQQAHQEMGAEAARQQVDLLVAVGDYATGTVAGALAEGMQPSQALAIDQLQDAVELVRERLAPGVTVLVKGSRGARMERLVDALLATEVRTWHS